MPKGPHRTITLVEIERPWLSRFRAVEVIVPRSSLSCGVCRTWHVPGRCSVKITRVVHYGDYR